ncbi:hypothetical protein FGG08_005308 [Glutinoglossum americanum]|uniref:Uncharacterized protein n=1 Tax=Glutinoglossum americanum TaxID=1670608 RepID=A0A9P8L1K2_9PEZI|nr:hypothetical protein FGG08_005308 [Glutinoglossum americanum]
MGGGFRALEASGHSPPGLLEASAVLPGRIRRSLHHAVAMAQQPTYLLTPNFTFKPITGPIALGSIIADPFRPHRVLTSIDGPTLSAYPRVETVLEYDKQLFRDSSRNASFSIWAQFLQTVTAKANVARAADALAQYTMDSLETMYFVADPSQEEIEARIKEPRVQAVIKSGGLLGKRQPVYMVTGLKIAKNFAGVSESGARREKGVEAGGAVPTPTGNAALGANVASSASRKDKDEWRTGADIVFAYQLLIIEVTGWRDKTVVYDEFRHKAAYLIDDGDPEDEDETDDEKPVEFTASGATAMDLAGAGEGFAVSVVEVGEGEGKCLCISFSQE